MPKVHSHYENLQVARDAPPEAIRSAYRSLSSTYHPDRNADNADASRIMAVINVAYGVLSDPVKRHEHDAWIEQAERAGGASDRVHRRVQRAGARIRESPFTPHEPAAPAPREAAPAPAEWPGWALRAFEHLARYGVAYALAGLVLYALFGREPAVTIGAPLARAGNAAIGSAAQYVRPAEAPNGRRWPEQSGYVEGYERRNAGGLSEITIDNAGNDADMFAKLVALDGPQAYPVRMVLIRAHSRFKLTQIASGTYDLRYRNLADGGLARTQFFTLEEVPTPNGPRASHVTLSLDKARDGKLQTYGLTEPEF